MSTAIDAMRLQYQANFEFDYAAGIYASRFMSEERDNAKLFGTRCTNCSRVLVPPRPVCGICSARTGEWVEVGPTGTITGFTVVEIPFIDPMTGVERPVPYGFAFIKLTGADTNIYHFLEESRHERLHVGMEVEAVFREERVGSMSDIERFRTVEGDS
ncbi:MAG: Zn-ribbon domain-containing OB-fold protein [Nostocoides sp.]